MSARGSKRQFAYSRYWPLAVIETGHSQADQIATTTNCIVVWLFDCFDFSHFLRVLGVLRGSGFARAGFSSSVPCQESPHRSRANSCCWLAPDSTLLRA